MKKSTDKALLNIRHKIYSIETWWIIIIYLKQTVQKCFGHHSRRYIRCLPNSHLLRDLVNKIVVIKAAIIFSFSRIHSRSVWILFLVLQSFMFDKYSYTLTVWLGILIGSLQTPYLRLYALLIEEISLPRYVILVSGWFTQVKITNFLWKSMHAKFHSQIRFNRLV